MHRITILILTTPLLFLGGISSLFADEVVNQVQTECSSCHAIENPHFENLPVEERIERKAPPLFYAGNKFRRDWLVQWLQDPVRIRPAGYFPPSHTVSGTDGDKIDDESLAPHPNVDAEKAEAFTNYLMSLHPYDSILESVDYEPGNIAIRMGQLTFGKFNGCDACHQDEPDYGGLSGPELYSAWERLQPAFIASYILNPEVWDPHTLMPNKELNSKNVAKLVNYLKAIKEE